MGPFDDGAVVAETPSPAAQTASPPMRRAAQFQSIIRALCEAAQPALLRAVGRAHVEVVRPGLKRTVVLAYEDETRDALVARLDEHARARPAESVAFVLVGGPAEVGPWMRAIQPTAMIRRVIQVLHVADGGEIWVRPASGTGDLRKRVAAAAAAAAAVPETEPEFRARLAAIAEEQRAEVAAIEAFLARQRGRRVLAVPALALSIVAVYVVEVLSGGADSVPTLVRLGGNAPHAIAAGEVWRLLSSTFLHAGFLHLFGNLSVLLVSGTFLERLVGTPRFLALWVAAGLGGGLASALSSPAVVSIGASSSLWGVWGALLVLVLRPGDAMPAFVAVSLKRGLAIGLVLNAAISLAPGVDWRAHLGGGLVGAGLALVALRRVATVPTAARLPSDPPAGQPASRAELVWRAVAALAVLALVGSLGIALVRGRPFGGVPDEWARRDLGESGVSMELPAHLAPTPPVERPIGLDVTFGDPVLDGLVISVGVSTNWLMPEDPTWHHELRKAAGTPPPGATPVGGVTEVTAGPDRWIEARFALDSGARLARFTRLTGRLLTVKVITIGSGEALPPGGVVRMLASVRAPAPLIEWERRRVGETGLSLDVPTTYSAREPADREGTLEYGFGSAGPIGGFVGVRVLAAPAPATPEAWAARRMDVETTSATAGLEPDGEVHERSAGGNRALERRWMTISTGVRFYRWDVAVGSTHVIVEAWQSPTDPWLGPPDTLRLVSSLRRDPTL